MCFILYSMVQKIQPRPVIQYTELLQYCSDVPGVPYDYFDCIYSLINTGNNYLLIIFCYSLHEVQYSQSHASLWFTLDKYNQLNILQNVNKKIKVQLVNTKFWN